MRITQGCFSALPGFTDDQIEYCLGKTLAEGVGYTDGPHPRSICWAMWGHLMFDLRDTKGVIMELVAWRKAFPDHYIRQNAFDSTRAIESVTMSFIVDRPRNEPSIRMTRIEVDGRSMRYSHTFTR
jgi:ribulose-bisphosphate carboxylase small chain